MKHIIEHEVFTTVRDLRSVLASFEHSLTRPELSELMSRVLLVPDQWKPHVSFDPNQFRFQSIYESSIFEVNVIGWRSGQQSSIHDHRGSSCCVLVLEGVMTNRDYRLSSTNELRETACFKLAPGGILSRCDRQLHRCGNEQPDGGDLVTLHLYSPPLRPLSERRYGSATTGPRPQARHAQEAARTVEPVRPAGRSPHDD